MAEGASPKKLQFDPKSLRSGKTSSIELNKKVKALHEELSKYEQNEADRESIAAVAKELVQPTLLLHKDRSVKAYIACCLADVLSLMAPDAPYTQNELRDVFAFIFRQLKNLGKSSGDKAHHQQYYYLLDSLSNAKSACLVCELANADEQIIEAFRDFFDIVGPDTPENVKSCMADILSQLLDESQTVPQDVVDILLAHLVPKLAKHRPPSYLLAVTVCNASSDRLQRYVSQYFTDIFTAASEQLATEGEMDSDDLGKAYNLIKELNHVVPAVLLNVIPQLEAELSVENVESRLLAARSLGQMFADGPGMLEHLAKRFPSAWRSWLGRSRDKVVAVRIVTIEHLKSIWQAHADLSKDIQDVLLSKLEDPDDKVRLAACAVFTQSDFEVIVHRCSVQTLHKLAERFRDKKASVTAEAAKALGKLYNLAYSEVATVEPMAVEKFSWIPDTLLRAYYTTDKGCQTAIEGAIYRDVLPLPHKDEEAAWVDRYLVVLSTLSERARTVLARLTHLSERRPTAYEKFIQICEAYNGGIMDNNSEKITTALENVARFLSVSFADTKKAHDDLIKFAKMNENRIYKLLKVLMDPQTDLKTLIKTNNECARRIEQSSHSLSETFVVFVRRSSLLLLNQSSVSTLLERLKDEGDDESTKRTKALAASVLSDISKGLPSLYMHHITAIKECVMNEESDPLLLTECLHALSEITKTSNTSLHYTFRFSERIKALALRGQQSQPKYAATILAYDTDSDNPVSLVENLVDDLSSGAPATKVAYLQALNRLAKFAITTLEARVPLLDEIIKNELLVGQEQMQVDGEVEDWQEDEDLQDETRVLVLALKVYCNLHLSTYKLEKGKNSNAMQLAIKFFLGFLDVQETEKRFSPPDAARLRLQATYSLLKIASVSELQPKVLVHLERLASMIQDYCFSVRQRFIQKLGKYMASLRLTNPQFNLLFYIVAVDPEEENVALAKQSVLARLQKCPPDRKLQLFEMPFVRFLHLLSHHPDFSATDTAELVTFAKYLDFFLDCIANSENVGLLYHLAARVRSVRDAVSQGHSTNIYVLSELAQHLINHRAATHAWTVSTYSNPKSISLPADIFKPLPSSEVMQKIAKQTWLPADAVAAIDAELKLMKSDAKVSKSSNRTTKKSAKPRKRKSDPEQSDAESKAKPKKRRTSNDNAKGKTKPKRKKSVASGSSSESDDEMALAVLKAKAAALKKGKQNDQDEDEAAPRRSGRARKQTIRDLSDGEIEGKAAEEDILLE